MPFTFSHPAFILPAKYLPAKYVSLTGLVIGSITPDFEYFFRMDVVSYYSHSLAGIFYFNLPVVFLISLLFHLVLKAPLALNSPDFIVSRFVDLIHSDFLKYLKNNILVYFLSALMGIISHLFIDSFTHISGYFVHEFSVLNISYNFFGINVPGYRLLQHFTSILGLIILFIYVFKLPENRNFIKAKKASVIQYWILIILVTVLLLLLRYFLGPISLRIGYWAINTISCGMISLTYVSVYWKFFRKV